MTRSRVQTLRGAGLSSGAVAAQLGMSPRTVQRIAKEEPITGPGSVDEAASKRVGRPSKVMAYKPQIERWLAEDPKIRLGVVLERLRAEGYELSLIHI